MKNPEKRCSASCRGALCAQRVSYALNSAAPFNNVLRFFYFFIFAFTCLPICKNLP